MIAVGERIIVKEQPPKETSAGGVFLAPDAREEPNRGEIVSVGPKVREDIRAGMYALYTKFEGQVLPAERQEDGTVLVSLAEKELIATF